MGKHSAPVMDRVTRTLGDRTIRVVDGDTENVVIDALLDKKFIDWPTHWKARDFSPCNNVGHAFDVLHELHQGQDWYVDHTGGVNGGYEVYVVDPAHAVSGFDLARTVVLAMWNHHLEVEKKRSETV